MADVTMQITIQTDKALKIRSQNQYSRKQVVDKIK
jgi:hypothetical protein